MATVVITFFLFARFYVYKMDADWLESQRDQFLSQREKRWSMNSQRLEEIVAELMKPISSDGRRNFDTDLSTLLEEYLTEAGLHALDAEDEDPSAAALVAPNFTEIALLLQQSANIYGRKVDFLYNHVISVSDSLLQSTQELANASMASGAGGAGGAGAAEPQTPTSLGRRRRRASCPSEFSEVELQAWGGAAREAEALRPPPTLPRMYIELEPRAPTAVDLPLLDYANENIGLLSDFQVTWRLHEGFLVDELEVGSAPRSGALRPISLVELHAALQAAAPASPPPHLEPLRASTPLPHDHAAPPALDHTAETPLDHTADTHTALTPLDQTAETATLTALDRTTETAVVVKKARKRRSNIQIDDIFNGSFKIIIENDLMLKLKQMREFSIDKRWINSVVQKRKSHILSERKRLADELTESADPDETQPPDRGFSGFTVGEAALSLAVYNSRLGELDEPSDDDGFFEQSSGGGSVRNALQEGDDPDAWKVSVLRRAAAAEARGSFDVHALGARVLSALSAERALPVARVLRAHVQHRSDVSRVMLATLFLANAGNVEIVQGEPLTVNSCSVRLLSRDMRRLRVVAAEDEQLLR